jgi:hypothetical protein
VINAEASYEVFTAVGVRMRAVLGASRPVSMMRRSSRF